MNTKRIARRSNIFYGAVALLFALILFFNANGRNLSSPFVSSTEDFEETATKVQVHATYDDTKYFIHGFDPYVNVKISSANRIQLNSEVNPDTRGFRIVADLTGLAEGTHDIKLRIQNESTGVKYQIEPTSISVTIEKRVTQEFDVEGRVSSSNLGDGYELKNVTVTPSKVTVTTGDQTLKQIDKVVATVDPSKNSEKDFSEAVNVRALDKDGNSLSIIADPVQVTVKVTVSAPKKEVDLYAAQSGDLPNGIDHYEFTLEKTTAEISGPLAKLNELERLPVTIDISGITEQVTRAFPIETGEGITSSPATVTVTVTPVRSSGNNNNNSNTNSGTNNQGAANQNNSNNGTTPSQNTENNQNNNGANNGGTVSSSSQDKTEESQPKEPTEASSETVASSNEN